MIGYNGLCSEGFYCPEGIQIEQPCEKGTYSNQTGRKSKVWSALKILFIMLVL